MKRKGKIRKIFSPKWWGYLVIRAMNDRTGRLYEDLDLLFEVTSERQLRFVAARYLNIPGEDLVFDYRRKEAKYRVWIDGFFVPTATFYTWADCNEEAIDRVARRQGIDPSILIAHELVRYEIKLGRKTVYIWEETRELAQKKAEMAVFGKLLKFLPKQRDIFKKCQA